MSNLDCEYKPIDSSESIIASEEERVPTNKMRHSGEEQASINRVVPQPCELVSTSSVKARY